MKKLLLIIAATILLAQITAAADEYTSNADIDYSYDANYDESTAQEETTSKKYDNIEESYSSSYDEADGRVDYYGDELEEPVYYDDYSNSTYNNENEVFEEPYDEDYNNSNYYNDDIMVFIDDFEVVFDVPPMIINDRTMVPLRAIFEALGADVEWDDSTKTAIGNLDGIVVEISIGENYMYRDGERIELDSPAVIIDGRTLVPARAIAEGYNCDVDWNGEYRIVYIYSPLYYGYDYFGRQIIPYVDSEWAEDDSFSVDGWDVPYKVLSEPVADCIEFCLDFGIHDITSGNPYGNWNLYALTGSGVWEKLYSFDYPENYEYVEEIVGLEYPITLKAIALARDEGEPSDHMFWYDASRFIISE